MAAEEFERRMKRFLREKRRGFVSDAEAARVAGVHLSRARRAIARVPWAARYAEACELAEQAERGELVAIADGRRRSADFLDALRVAVEAAPDGQKAAVAAQMARLEVERDRLRVHARYFCLGRMKRLAPKSASITHTFRVVTDNPPEHLRLSAPDAVAPPQAIEEAEYTVVDDGRDPLDE